MKRKYIFFSKYCTVSGSPVCGSEELPEADFNFCAPDVRTSEIRRIFVGRVDGDEFADYSVAFEWLLRVSQTSNDKNALRPLVVIGDKPAPNSMRRQLSMERKQTVKKDHTINFTIDDVSAANHAFVEWMRSGKYMRLWYETTGRFMFGGNAGIVAYVNIDMVLPRGGGEIMTYQGTITWSNLRTEDRVISPIYDDATGECGDVENIVLDNVTFSDADVTWDSDPLVGAYQWAVTESDTEPTTGLTLTYDNTAHISFLNPETTYYFWVRAICNNGMIGAWRFQTFETSALPVCNVLTGVGIADINETYAAVLWDTDSGIQDVLVAFNTTGIEPAPGTGTATPNIDGIFYISPLDAETTYYVWVARVCGAGYFSAWVTVSFETLEARPVMPITANMIFDYDSNYGVTKSGTDVISIDDLSGNGNDISTLAGIVGFVPAAFGTKPGISFHNSVMQTAGNLIGLDGRQKFTIYVVVDYGVLPEAEVIFDYSSSKAISILDGFYGFLQNPGAGPQVGIQMKGNVGVQQSFINTVHNQRFIAEFIVDNAAPGDHAIAAIYLVGGGSGNSGNAGAVNTNSFGNYPLTVGSYADQSDACTFRMAKMVGYASAFTSSQRLATVNYLKARYSF